MQRLLRLLEITNAGAALAQSLALRHYLADICVLLVLVMLSQAMTVVLLGGGFYLLYAGIQHYGITDPQIALIITAGAAILVALMIFTVTYRRFRRFGRIGRVTKLQDRIVQDIGDAASAFMEGFSEGRPDE